MRRSLWSRLMGVFLGVILLGVVVMVISVRISTASQLRRRVLSDDVAQANELARLMAAYYADQGSWAGVDAWLEELKAPLWTAEGPFSRRARAVGADWVRWVGEDAGS